MEMYYDNLQMSGWLLRNMYRKIPVSTFFATHMKNVAKRALNAPQEILSKIIF
jgi:hypothetical protein